VITAALTACTARSPGSLASDACRRFDHLQRADAGGAMTRGQVLDAIADVRKETKSAAADEGRWARLDRAVARLHDAVKTNTEDVSLEDFDAQRRRVVAACGDAR
jgi:hypothetical protein